MGEMAEWSIQQAMDAEWGDYEHDDYGNDEYVYGYDPIDGAIIRARHSDEHYKHLAENEMEEFKMAEIKRTYTIDVNSEKKIYRIKPPLARGSFMRRILEPEAYEEGDDKEWGCQLRWPMDEPEVAMWVKDMARLFQQIFVDKFGMEKAKKLMSNPNVRIPLRNGNNETNDEYEGWWFMNVRNKFRQPMIIGPHGKAIPKDLINDQTIYSGAWYRSRLTVKHFEVKGHVIGSFIDVLMKIKDDERLDSIIDVEGAEDEFSEFASDDAFDTAVGEQDAQDDGDPLAGFGGGATGSTPSETKDQDDDFSFLK